MAGHAKQSTGLKTRDSIQEAARELFLRQGYHATGMRQIASEAGISLGAVYNHFSSKEEILKAILAEHNLHQAIAEALLRARGDTVAELMESGYSEIMATLQGKEYYVSLLFLDVLEFQGRHVAQLAAVQIPRIMGFFQRLYHLGRQGGELRDLSPVLLGRTYIQLVFSSYILENVLKILGQEQVVLPLRVENWQKGLIDILLRGVLERPFPSEGRAYP